MKKTFKTQLKKNIWARTRDVFELNCLLKRTLFQRFIMRRNISSIKVQISEGACGLQDWKLTEGFQHTSWFFLFVKKRNFVEGSELIRFFFKVENQKGNLMLLRVWQIQWSAGENPSLQLHVVNCTLLPASPLSSDITSFLLSLPSPSHPETLSAHHHASRFLWSLYLNSWCFCCHANNSVRSINHKNKLIFVLFRNTYSLFSPPLIYIWLHVYPSNNKHSSCETIQSND